MGRRLGQHFLSDPNILGRIASAASPAGALVIEIGPGHGGLTRALLSSARRVIAIELDPVLAASLPQDARLEVIRGDVLDTNLAQWGPAVVAGNLPYYITSPIIEKTLGMGTNLLRAVFLVQKEAAARLAAAPGSRDYGYLSVATQLTCRVETLFDVKPGAFRPPPKVDSTVVRLTPRSEPARAGTERFLRFASQCFRQKRKTLRNNLAGVYGRAAVEAQPEAGLRAEQVAIEQLVDLYLRLQQY
ncbi:MAG: ribosomal RNA small subunit methyltransferase A [Bryobacterales bacterium]|nr:ribosomal RNA small subunit methyltransferase A [Bryobacterales bacterium]